MRVKGKLQNGSVVEEKEALSFFVGEGEVVQGMWCGVSQNVTGQPITNSSHAHHS